MHVFWPDVFSQPIEAEYYPEMDERRRKLMALGDQLFAWGNCLSGKEPPESFGAVMAKLGGISGAHTREDCHRLAKEALS